MPQTSAAPSGTGFVEVKAASFWTCALDSSGRAKCWGGGNPGTPAASNPPTDKIFRLIGSSAPLSEPHAQPTRYTFLTAQYNWIT